MANMKINSTAAAKEGKESNPAETVDAIRSTTPPWFEPAIRASGIEMSNAIRIASTASSAVTGNRCAIISDTGNDVRVDSPRSPCRADPTQLKYLTKNGSSRPISFVSLSTCSGEASLPRMATAADPGIKLTAAVASIVMMMTTGSSRRSRMPTCFNTVHPSLRLNQAEHSGGGPEQTHPGMQING